MSNTSNLSHKAISGFIWLFAQTLLVKFVNMAGQIVLAWLLFPKDFGLVGLAYTITSPLSLIQQAGIRDILMRRSAKFERWETPAFWMAFTIGLTFGIGLFLAAPLAGAFYKAPAVAGLLRVLAISAFINNIAIVPQTRVESKMLFRSLALNNLFLAIGQLVLSIVFAKLGFGAYSFVLPTLIMSLVRVIWLSKLAQLKVKPQFQFRYWKYFYGDSAVLIAASIFSAIIWQGDYIILGRTHSPYEVGLYYFAFNLSLQTVMLVTANISAVILPTLSQLRSQPERQLAAFLKMERFLALLGIPICFWQASVSTPLIKLFFHPRWIEAAPIMAVLSVGMAMRVVEWPSENLIKAQGRFRVILNLAISNAAVFFVLVGLAATWGGAIAIAWAVAICLTLFSPLRIYVAIRALGGGWNDIRKIFLVPVATGALTFGMAALLASSLGRFLPQGKGLDIAQITLVSGLGCCAYVFIVRSLARDVWDEGMQKIKSVAAGKLGRSKSAPAPTSS